MTIVARARKLPDDVLNEMKSLLRISDKKSGSPVVAEDLGEEQNQDRFYVTRQELIPLVDEALRARGVA